MSLTREQLPTLQVLAELRRGQCMALRLEAFQLAADSRALKAEATLIARRSRELVPPRRRSSPAVGDPRRLPREAG